METEMLKSKPLTKEETKTLLEFIDHSVIITTKATNASNNKLKNEEWVRLAARFNATATCPITPQQLRLKWENLKKNSHKRSTKIRMNRIQTGGGVAEYIPPDDILDRVSSLLGSTVSGFSVPFGGDKEPEEFVVLGGGSGGDGSGGDSSCHEFIGGDARVVIDNILGSEVPAPAPSNSIITVLDDSQIQSCTSSFEPKRLTFTTPRDVKKKFKPDRFKMDKSKMERNFAIAEYYRAKKLCLDAKLNNILIQNEKISLENEKYKLEIKKLKND